MLYSNTFQVYSRLKRLLKDMVHNPNVRNTLLNLPAGRKPSSDNMIPDIPDLNIPRGSISVSSVKYFCFSVSPVFLLGSGTCVWDSAYFSHFEKSERY